ERAGGNGTRAGRLKAIYRRGRTGVAEKACRIRVCGRVDRMVRIYIHARNLIIRSAADVTGKFRHRRGRCNKECRDEAVLNPGKRRLKRMHGRKIRGRGLSADNDVEPVGNQRVVSQSAYLIIAAASSKITSRYQARLAALRRVRHR